MLTHRGPQNGERVGRVLNALCDVRAQGVQGCEHGEHSGLGLASAEGELVISPGLCCCTGIAGMVSHVDKPGRDGQPRSTLHLSQGRLCCCAEVVSYVTTYRLGGEPMVPRNAANRRRSRSQLQLNAGSLGMRAQHTTPPRAGCGGRDLLHVRDIGTLAHRVRPTGGSG